MDSRVPSQLANTLIEAFLSRKASDLYLITGSKPSMHLEGMFSHLREEPLTEEEVREVINAMVAPEGIAHFNKTQEYNTAIEWHHGAGRLRLNLFVQRQAPGVVIRRINTRIPTLEELGLPRAYAQLAMEKRGLVLVVGPTGSGKSTSLAAMVGHRNRYGSGHIVTIEDPVEFVHEHKGCIVSQRDVGVDTDSYANALKNALRQSPDVVMIGEARDAETMDHAIAFAETGHLVLATLHSNNAHQAIERVLNFFPLEKHRQVLLNLSLNLRGILSQRLVLANKGKRVMASEVMLNQGLIRDLIAEGKVRELRECIEKSRDIGMQSFDQVLYELRVDDQISEEQAMVESDNPASLRVLFKQLELQRKMGMMKSASDPSAT